MAVLYVLVTESSCVINDHLARRMLMSEDFSVGWRVNHIKMRSVLSGYVWEINIYGDAMPYHENLDG